ncbi:MULTISPECIES: DNA-processing protein DprA [Bacillus]|uniref:DNA-processing protein DprA n=1 Tax=Bacillus TaxID=1386 RepID=UPI000BB9492A|nr:MULTISPECIES: DNA-processing protein DprA [Bacillus]
MDKWKQRLLHLHHCSSITRNILFKILRFDPDLKNIFNFSTNDLTHHLRITKSSAEKIYSQIRTVNIEKFLCNYNLEQIIPITFKDPLYPLLLKEIYDPPLVLYCKGDISLFHSKKVSIVGTRNPTMYANKALELILPSLIKEGFTIVSGLATGVDTNAHKLTIENNGKTIAILGSGLFNVYPKENIALANTIAREHLLVSEYTPYTPPQRWQFPFRNRIISGLSSGTVIVEAKERSGSLITAEQALEQGRDVFAIPGSIFSPTSIGTNLLIQQGAKLVMKAEDILEEI